MFSLPNRKSVATALAGAAIASAMVVSGAGAMPDYPTSGSEGHQDLRSPDAVDAARAAGDPPSVPPTEDQMHPGLADRARAANEAASVEPPIAEASSSGGFDWVSAAIGAAGATGLGILLLAAGGLAGRRPLRAS